MARITIHIILLCFCLTGLMVQGTLILKTKTGGQVSYTLDDIRNITFSEGNMLIHKKNITQDAIAIGDVMNLLFGEATSVVALADQNGGLLIYPNPVKDELHVRIQYGSASQAVVRIVDFQGKAVYSATLNGRPGEITGQLPVTALQKGMYLLRVETGDDVISRKFIKQ